MVRLLGSFENVAVLITVPLTFTVGTAFWDSIINPVAEHLGDVCRWAYGGNNRWLGILLTLTTIIPDYICLLVLVIFLLVILYYLGVSILRTFTHNSFVFLRRKWTDAFGPRRN